MNRWTLTALVALAAAPAVAGAQQRGYSTRELQVALNQAGYYEGPRTGRMTTATRAAVRRAAQELGVASTSPRAVLSALNGDDAMVSGSSTLRSQGAAAREPQTTPSADSAAAPSAAPSPAPSAAPTTPSTDTTAMPRDTTAMPSDTTAAPSPAAPTTPDTTGTPTTPATPDTTGMPTPPDTTRTPTTPPAPSTPPSTPPTR